MGFKPFRGPKVLPPTLRAEGLERPTVQGPLQWRHPIPRRHRGEACPACPCVGLRPRSTQGQSLECRGTHSLGAHSELWAAREAEKSAAWGIRVPHALDKAIISPYRKLHPRKVPQIFVIPGRAWPQAKMTNQQPPPLEISLRYLGARRCGFLSRF